MKGCGSVRFGGSLRGEAAEVPGGRAMAVGGMGA